MEWEFGMPLGATLCVAKTVFECDVLGILLSEFHEWLEENTLGIQERTNASTMSVVIMVAVHIQWNDFCRMTVFF